MKYVTFDPRISLGIWITLAVAAVLLLGLYAVTSRRRLAGQRWLVVILLMSLVLAIPMIVLLNPTWVERVPPPAGKPSLVVLLDRSASMATIDGEVRESRYEIAAKTACRLAEQLESQYDVQFKIFDQASAPTTADEFSEMMPEGPLTDLASAVRTALEEDRPQGQALVVLSDGIQNVGGPDGLRDAAARANAVATPIFAQVIGGTAEINDLEVKLDLPEEIAFIDQEITANVRLKQRGNTAAQCKLRVLRDGKPHSENTATLRPNGETVEIVKLREEKPGLFRYEIAVEPLVGEVTDVNNTATLLLRVMDQPVRVLLLEGNPYWDTKFLIRTLAADRLTELVSLVQLTPGRVLERRVVSQTAATAPGKTDGTDKSDSVNSGISESDSSDTQANETSKDSVQAEDAWAIHENTDSLLTGNDSFAPYQIVVLGRDAGVFLTPEVVTRLEKWVSEGNGSLVCYRGAPVSNVSERLATLLPVRWAPARESRFRVQWAESAASAGWLSAMGNSESISYMPSLAQKQTPRSPWPLAVVLATADSASRSEPIPVVTYQHVGNGRVVVIEGAGMWRWAFLSPRNQADDEVYGRLWRSMLRWLVANVRLLPSQPLRLSTDKVTYLSKENVVAELLLRQETVGDKVPVVELHGPGLDVPRTVIPTPSGDYPGQFRVPFGPLPEGRYRAQVVGADPSDAAAVVAFDVRENLQERLDVTARPDTLRLLADKSNGALFEQLSPQLLAKRFEEHLDRVRPERIVRTSAWDRWWVLIATLAVCSVTWGMRRWSGLV